MFDLTALERERLLLVVAHPDDESIGAGILLQRNQNMHVVFCTSGAPNNRSIWRRFGTPWHYARTREREARAALKLACNDRYTFLSFRDGKLYLSLPRVYERLSAIVKSWQPACIVTHAYEGGHQDHDVCSFLCSRLARASGIQVQEMPLYRLDRTNGGIIYQQFAEEDKGIEILRPTPSELRTKQQMLDAHHSQLNVLKVFDPSRETFRPQSQYNYGRPAIEGLSKMAVSEVATEEVVAAFTAFADNEAKRF